MQCISLMAVFSFRRYEKKLQWDRGIRASEQMYLSSIREYGGCQWVRRTYRSIAYPFWVAGAESQYLHKTMYLILRFYFVSARIDGFIHCGCRASQFASAACRVVFFQHSLFTLCFHSIWLDVWLAQSSSQAHMFTAPLTRHTWGGPFVLLLLPITSAIDRRWNGFLVCIWAWPMFAIRFDCPDSLLLYSTRRRRDGTSCERRSPFS